MRHMGLLTERRQAVPMLAGISWTPETPSGTVVRSMIGTKKQFSLTRAALGLLVRK